MKTAPNTTRFRITATRRDAFEEIAEAYLLARGRFVQVEAKRWISERFAGKVFGPPSTGDVPNGPSYYRAPPVRRIELLAALAASVKKSLVVKPLRATLPVAVDGFLPAQCGPVFKAYFAAHGQAVPKAGMARFVMAQNGVVLTHPTGRFVLLRGMFTPQTGDKFSSYCGKFDLDCDLLAKGGPFRVDEQGGILTIASLSKHVSKWKSLLAIVRAEDKSSSAFAGQLVERMRSGGKLTFQPSRANHYGSRNQTTEVVLSGGKLDPKRKKEFEARIARLEKRLGQIQAAVGNFKLWVEELVSEFLANPAMQLVNDRRALLDAVSKFESAARFLREAQGLACYKTHVPATTYPWPPASFPEARPSANDGAKFQLRNAQTMFGHAWHDLLEAGAKVPGWFSPAPAKATRAG